MMQALRRRTNRDEEGFTLIELMVVVLIIAILLAIAIPTFLGARNKAQARGAQSNLRNALTAEKTVFTDSSTYAGSSTTDLATLVAAEPALKWSTNSTTLAGGLVGVLATNQNVAVTTQLDNVVLSAVDASGTKCWYVVDETSVATAGTRPVAGTYYGFTNSVTASPVSSCPAMSAATGPVTAPTAAATVSGTWGTSW